MSSELLTKVDALEPLSTGQRLRIYLQENWLSIFSAFVLGLAFPIWKIYVYEAPDISVEVTEVDKTSEAVKIEISRDPAFKPLFENRFPSGIFFDDDARARGVDLAQLERMIETRKDALEREESRLPDQRRNLDELRNSQRFDAQIASRINSPLVPEIDFDPKLFRDGKQADIDRLKAKFVARLEVDLEERERNLVNQKKAFEVAKTAFTLRQQQANLKLAKLAIKCAISNSGAGAISLRPQAFLRVYLGGNNYVDVELNMRSYDQKGDMQPKSSRIVTYESDPMEKLRESDQDKINTYFKQNVPAVLFIVDINARVYQSNTVPFAQGLYQQSVFDRLRSEASKRKTPDLK